MRLDKFLSDQNVGTRSVLKQEIKKGLVTVNGETVTKPETPVDPKKDRIQYKRQDVLYAPFHYYMLNKPVGVVSARTDQRDRTVLDLLPGELQKNLFPVGRLDKDAEGLLLLTDDGDLSHRLLSPKKHVDKTYIVHTDREIPKEAAERFRQGVDIGEKHLTLPAEVFFSDRDPHECLLTIREGKFHQIKRMFGTLGLTVTGLKRMKMGTLSLDGALLPGQFRSLTKEEIGALKGLTGLC